MKFLHQLGVRQYAAKYKSINYYNKFIIMIQYRIGFIKVQRLVSEYLSTIILPRKPCNLIIY